MRTLQFYTRKNCGLCESALALVRRVQKKFDFHLDLINIDEDPALVELYGNVLPVIRMENRELARSFIVERNLLKQLSNSSPAH